MSATEDTAYVSGQPGLHRVACCRGHVVFMLQDTFVCWMFAILKQALLSVDCNLE